MIDMKNMLSALPPMKSGKELASAMSVLPEYDKSICFENQAIRLMALSGLYNIYIPAQMSMEIYSKLYLALLRSLQKKGTVTAIKQTYENHKAITGQEYSGIMGGSDSFTIIGASGIGKSSAISRAISLISENRIIETINPYSKIIPCLVVQCPFDSSVKGLLLEILRKVDDLLDSTYYQYAVKSRTATSDMLIGLVSSIALNHIGLLVVDEIQNVVNSKNGRNLVGMLTQLINNSGISICMVGVPECKEFFQAEMQLARRSLGLSYDVMSYGAEFIGICRILYSYQYVQTRTEITDAIITWLYEHSGGILSVVVSLIHDAQELSILSGKEILNLETLNEAYQKRVYMLHDYIEPMITRKSQTTRKKLKNAAIKESATTIEADNVKIADLAFKAKTEGIDMFLLLREHFPVFEVMV